MRGVEAPQHPTSELTHMFATRTRYIPDMVPNKNSNSKDRNRPTYMPHSRDPSHFCLHLARAVTLSSKPRPHTCGSDHLTAASSWQRLDRHCSGRNCRLLVVMGSTRKGTDRVLSIYPIVQYCRQASQTCIWRCETRSAAVPVFCLAHFEQEESQIESPPNHHSNKN